MPVTTRFNAMFRWLLIEPTLAQLNNTFGMIRAIISNQLEWVFCTGTPWFQSFICPNTGRITHQECESLGIVANRWDL